MGAAGCLHSGPALNGPEGVARSYARALAEGRVNDAWALSAPLDREQFAARYADPGVRRQRSEALERAASGLPSAAVSLEVGERGWRVLEQPTPAAGLADEEQAKERISHFLSAVDSSDFQAVFNDLSASWRARYTPPTG